MWIFCWFLFTLYQFITGQTGCQDVHSISGYSLTGHSYRMMSRVRLITFIVTCQDDPGCYSLNFKPTLQLCELNSATLLSAESKYVVPSADNVYLENLYRPYRPCDNAPCKNGGICITTNYYPGFQCNCQKEYIGPTCEECPLFYMGTLGVQSGKILDSQIVASSHQPNFEAFKARLKGPSCWKSAQNVVGEYLEVNFLSQKKYITGIETQGDPHADNWTELFYLAYSLGSVWKNVTHPQGGNLTIFKGNSDRYSFYGTVFSKKQIFHATAVRIYPLKWHGNMALRLELFGC